MWRWVFLVLLVVPLAAQAGGTAAAKYQALVVAAKRGERIDCRALRFAWVDAMLEDLRGPTGPAKSSDAGAQAHQDMRKAFAAEDWTRAAAQAQIALDADFIDVDAHMTRDVSFRMLGKADQGRQNYQMATCLLQSIKTGDGLSPATAMTVVRVSEEYTMLRLAGLRPERQSLIEQGGHFYDVLEATDEHGKRFSLYFLIDRVREIELALVEAMPK
jgi:hypothetical protein